MDIELVRTLTAMVLFFGGAFLVVDACYVLLLGFVQAFMQSPIKPSFSYYLVVTIVEALITWQLITFVMK